MTIATSNGDVHVAVGPKEAEIIPFKNTISGLGAEIARSKIRTFAKASRNDK